MLSVVSYQSLGIGDLGSLGWILCLLRVGLKEIPFLGEEVFSVLSCLSGDKSPELDGFPMTFWQNRQDFVKIEVLGFFKEFFKWGYFVRSLVVTFFCVDSLESGRQGFERFQVYQFDGRAIQAGSR